MADNLLSQNPAETVGNTPKGGRKNRNKDQSGDDDKSLLQGADTSLVPTVGDKDEGDESLKIRIRLNLKAKVKLELEADIQGEIVIGLL
ncbi:hypothetical protein HFD88_007805 [Aspergillus terreus]|nr:hypothetical protein HFD88_007805 [Aspergillus terreus]